MSSYRFLQSSVDVRTMRIYIIGEIMFRIERNRQVTPQYGIVLGSDYLSYWCEFDVHNICLHIT